MKKCVLNQSYGNIVKNLLNLDRIFKILHKRSLKNDIVMTYDFHDKVRSKSV
jgi:hypothetical protein